MAIEGILLVPTLILPVTLILTTLCLIHFYQTNKRSYKQALRIPGPPPLPLIGNAHLILQMASKTDVVKKALEYAEIYTPTARAFLGAKVVVFITHPDDIEIILNSNEHLEKSEEYRFFEPWLGDGLLISKGDKWRSHRKMIAPTFHTNILKSFVSVFYRNSLGVVHNLKKEIGREFDIHEYMSEVTTDILLETAMGYDKSKDKGRSGLDYAIAVMEMCDIIHLRHYKVWYRIEALFNLLGYGEKQNKLLNRIHGLTRRVIKSKKEIFQRNIKEGNLPKPSFSELVSDVPSTSVSEKVLKDDIDVIDEMDVGEKRRLAFLDLMIESAHYGAEITDEEIKEEVDTIMFEGHDTTAAASSFVLCLLGAHQDIQTKVYEELKTIFGTNMHRPVTFNDTVEMKYLERVILESLRLYPPVPAIARKVKGDVKLASSDLVIPGGSTVVIGTYKLHRSPDFYKNPDKFDPDNFLPENTQNRKYFAYIPFSAGPRSCVGRKYAMLKLKVLLSTILRAYHIKTDVKESEYQLIGDIILKRADDFRIEVEPRGSK